MENELNLLKFQVASLAENLDQVKSTNEGNFGALETKIDSLSRQQ